MKTIDEKNTNSIVHDGNEVGVVEIKKLIRFANGKLLLHSAFLKNLGEKLSFGVLIRGGVFVNTILTKHWTTREFDWWEFESRDAQKLRLLEVSVTREDCTAIISEYSICIEDLDYIQNFAMEEELYMPDGCFDVWKIVPYIDDEYMVQVREPSRPQKVYRNRKGIYILYRGQRLYLQPSPTAK